MNSQDLAETVKLYNDMAKDPVSRIRFTQEITLGLGRMLFIPTVCLEQLINAQESDIKILKEEATKPGLIAFLADIGGPVACKELELLKAFLEVRATLIESICKTNPRAKNQFPE